MCSEPRGGAGRGHPCSSQVPPEISRLGSTWPKKSPSSLLVPDLEIQAIVIGPSTLGKEAPGALQQDESTEVRAQDFEVALSPLASTALLSGRQCVG